MRALVPLLFLLSTSCLVSKKTHDAAVTDLQGQLGHEQQLRAQAERSLELTDAKASELKTAVDALQAHSAELVGQVTLMEDAIRTLLAQTAQTQADRDALAEQVTALREGVSEAEVQVKAASDRLAILAEEKARLEAEKLQLEAEREQLVAKTSAYDDLVSSLKGEIDAGQVTITELQGKLTVNLSNAILFDSGKYALKAEGKAALEKVAAVLMTVDDREVRVEGHTDDDPVRAGVGYADNWALSALRASTVVALLEEGGVSADNIAVVGYGQQHPVASNDTPEGKAANRRTEIVLVPRLQQVGYKAP